MKNESTLLFKIAIFILCWDVVVFQWTHHSDRPQFKLRAYPSLRDDELRSTRLHQMKIDAIEQEYLKWAGDHTNL